MKILRHIIAGTLLLATLVALAQVENGTGVVRRSGKDRKKRGQTEAEAGVKITERMQNFYDVKEPHDADLAWMRVIYRQIDLSKDENAPLYFPEDVVDGKENLFRLILRLVVDGKVPAYEYLDGREIFTDKYQINVPEMLDRFGIYYQSSGSGRNGAITIEEADVPTTQVLNYYVIEKWEFDKRSNEIKTRVEAICPVLNRYGDFGGENRYPMFWVKFDVDITNPCVHPVSVREDEGCGGGARSQRGVCLLQIGFIDLPGGLDVGFVGFNPVEGQRLFVVPEKDHIVIGLFHAKEKLMGQRGLLFQTVYQSVEIMLK